MISSDMIVTEHDGSQWVRLEDAKRLIAALALRPTADDDGVDSAAQIADAVAGALVKYAVAYSHSTLRDMSTADRTWSVHETGHGNPFERDVWIGQFDNKADADALVSKLRRDAAIEAVRLLTLTKAPMSEDGWQSIELSPKDGTPFDVWIPTENGGGYRITDLFFALNGELRRVGERQAVQLKHWPTHWRALPNPPLGLTPTDRGDG